MIDPPAAVESPVVAVVGQPLFRMHDPPRALAGRVVEGGADLLGQELAVQVVVEERLGLPHGVLVGVQRAQRCASNRTHTRT